MRLISLLTLFFLSFYSTATYSYGGLEKGNLLLQEGHFVLTIQGTPYERGYQHGHLLKEKILSNIKRFIDNPYLKKHHRYQAFSKQLPTLLPHISNSIREEMQGVADGADVPFEKILILNLFPELFHCIGLTAGQEMTRNGSLYHVRVLDYSIGKTLQHTAVLILSKPNQGQAYLNVGYAGFVGAVTGMNANKIALGEVGGNGYGYWDGVPMAFLMKQILEEATNLDEAKNILSRAKRTCEYHYVISDGKTEEAIGIYATPSQFHLIHPGESYAFFTPQLDSFHYQHSGRDDKILISPFTSSYSDMQHLIFSEDHKLIGLINHQPKHCLIIQGHGHPERYPILIERMQKYHGLIDENILQEILKTPVTNHTNLHNAIFLPKTLELWISHAGLDGTPASENLYTYFNFSTLLQEISHGNLAR